MCGERMLAGGLESGRLCREWGGRSWVLKGGDRRRQRIQRPGSTKHCKWTDCGEGVRSEGALAHAIDVHILRDYCTVIAMPKIRGRNMRFLKHVTFVHGNLNERYSANGIFNSSNTPVGELGRRGESRDAHACDCLPSIPPSIHATASPSLSHSSAQGKINSNEYPRP